MLFCLTDENYIQIECLEEKLLTIKVQKIGHISCVHKLYFLMLGHKLINVLLDCHLTAKLGDLGFS